MGSAYNRVIETRKELTKQLLAEMEQGELPWMKGWKTTGTRPYNPVTKAVYKGNNRLRLMLASVLVKLFCNTLFDKYLFVTSLHWC